MNWTNDSLVPPNLGVPIRQKTCFESEACTPFSILEPAQCFAVEDPQMNQSIHVDMSWHVKGQKVCCKPNYWRLRSHRHQLDEQQKFWAPWESSFTSKRQLQSQKKHREIYWLPPLSRRLFVCLPLNNQIFGSTALSTRSSRLLFLEMVQHWPIKIFQAATVPWFSY